MYAFIYEIVAPIFMAIYRRKVAWLISISELRFKTKHKQQKTQNFEELEYYISKWNKFEGEPQENDRRPPLNAIMYSD